MMLLPGSGKALYAAETNSGDLPVGMVEGYPLFVVERLFRHASDIATRKISYRARCWVLRWWDPAAWASPTLMTTKT